MILDKFPIQLRASFGFKNMSLKEFESLDKKSKIIIPENGVIYVCVDDRIIAYAEVVIVDGLFGIQICEVVDIYIEKHLSIQIEFCFSEFTINDLKLEKGQIISLNKPVEGQTASLIINGFKSEDYNADFIVCNDIMYNHCLEFEIKKIGEYEQKEHNLSFLEIKRI